MPTSNLPVWVFWAQALGLPIFGLVIAGASVYIAWQQKRIADIRLRHELYDRRLRVYEAAKTLLVAHLINGKLTGDDYITYRRGTADAVFLLNARVLARRMSVQSENCRAAGTLQTPLLPHVRAAKFSIMRQILNDIEAGKVTDELRRRGIPSGRRLRVVVESIEAEEPSLTAINAAGGAFDWLAEEPDLYSDADLVERFRS